MKKLIIRTAVVALIARLGYDLYRVLDYSLEQEKTIEKLTGLVEDQHDAIVHAAYTIQGLDSPIDTDSLKARVRQHFAESGGNPQVLDDLAAAINSRTGPIDLEELSRQLFGAHAA